MIAVFGRAVDVGQAGPVVGRTGYAVYHRRCGHTVMVAAARAQAEAVAGVLGTQRGYRVRLASDDDAACVDRGELCGVCVPPDLAAPDRFDS